MPVSQDTLRINLTNEPPRRLDVEVGVYEGAPKQLEESGLYTIEDIPHIHNADLTVRHPLSGESEYLGDTRVMVAHGFRKRTPNGEDGWALADGRSVIGVARFYNERHPDNPIEFLAVCNPAQTLAKEDDRLQHPRSADALVSGQIKPSGAIGLHVRLTNPDRGAWFLSDGSGTLRPAL